MSEPLVLGVDTSGPYCSAALIRGGALLSGLDVEMPKGQVEALFPMLENLLAEGGAFWSDLSAIGVGTGPGNFTGIRISVSAMRGLALALDVPAVGVSLLDALAHAAPGPVLAAIAAPRGQAYIAGRGMAHDLAPALVAIEELPHELAEPGLVAIGSAGDAVAAHLGVPHAAPAFAPGEAIARIAATRWRTETAPATPFYLKAADAAPARDAPPVILDEPA
ncbi:tRNA (adenosine(37)-N6)-threonylcarbamoyltransferase complex dimerization subunit type 1 TsaB [Roseovarius aquimarinus]|uniref:tRNA (Adenosine(37)-N6)-threonylcarbamoyltransferase complex dimerization subunit type 1 TsaB n=1 Tax=Roseovarius aquimarinus TaxID=1229156 RepID=A0ABW7I9U3_9RHOB